MAFEIYKRKQGLWLRWGTFLCLALLFVFGTYRLYRNSFPESNDTVLKFIPVDWEWIHNDKIVNYPIPLVDIDLQITPRWIISVVLGFILVSASLYFVFVHSRVSEFLIETESEMRKVSWPTFKEVLNSSVVVIITMIFLALYLFGADYGLNWVFSKIFF